MVGPCECGDLVVAATQSVDLWREVPYIASENIQRVADWIDRHEQHAHAGRVRPEPPEHVREIGERSRTDIRANWV